MDNEIVQKVLENRPLMIVLMLAIAAGAIVSIAGGFLMTYGLVTLIGA
jgi:hypothetical protein